MRRIAILNQKGGVGKTTTAANLGAALAEGGRRVLLIDLDPQAHLTMHFGVEPGAAQPSMYALLTQGRPIAEALQPIREGLWLVGSEIDLAAAEVELASVVGREVILRDLLDEHEGNYDFVLVDCPPSLGILTLNALSAAEEVFIPLQPHFLALQGLGKLLETISLVARRVNPKLRVSGVIVCMYESGTRLASEVVEELERFLAEQRQRDVPWAGARVFRTVIRRNIRLAESPSHGLSIFDYAPQSHGAEDYRALAAEVIEVAPAAAGPARPQQMVATSGPVGSSDPGDATSPQQAGNDAPAGAAGLPPHPPQTADEPPPGSEGSSGSALVRFG